MKFVISGNNFEVTESLRSKAINKLSKLERFINFDADVYVTMSVEKNRHIVEVTIPFNGGVVLRAEESSDDMYASIDRVIDVLEGQIRKYKTKLKKKLYTGAIRAEYLEELDKENVDEEKEFAVVKTKKFPIKPMTTEEAILQMNLLGHQFFVFKNANTGETNVVYKRKDGNYGLIEPEY